MTPDMTPERTANDPYARGRTMPSAAPELGAGRIAQPAPGRTATLLVALIGVGALWAWSRPGGAHKAKRRLDMPTLDPAFIARHRLPLSRAPEAYRVWNDKTDDCTKIVLDPAA